MVAILEVCAFPASDESVVRWSVWSVRQEGQERDQTPGLEIVFYIGKVEVEWGKKDRSFCGCLRLAAVLHTQPSLPWQPHPPPLLTCSHTWSHADSKTHPHTFSVHHTVTSQQSAYTVWRDGQNSYFKFSRMKRSLQYFFIFAFRRSPFIQMQALQCRFLHIWMACYFLLLLVEIPLHVDLMMSVFFFIYRGNNRKESMHNLPKVAHRHYRLIRDRLGTSGIYESPDWSENRARW